VQYDISARPDTWTDSRHSGGMDAANAENPEAGRGLAGCMAVSISARPSRVSIRVRFCDCRTSTS